MIKDPIEIDVVVSDLRKMFKLETSNFSRENNGKFYVDKREFERLVVIEMLQEYFNDKYINNGHIVVDGITMVFTTFEIKKGLPNASS